MTQTQTPTRPVSVSELQRAWRAVREGEFRCDGPRPRPWVANPDPECRWSPPGPVITILGCHPQAGVSTLAVAMATVAAPAQVIECASATATGLACAATAELGTTDGWRIGRRGQVHLARASTTLLTPAEAPVPPALEDPQRLLVLDIGWELGQLLAGQSWVNRTVAEAASAVVTTTATTPGLRRLENALTMLSPLEPAIAVRGPARRRWPRHLEAGLGPLSTHASRAGRLQCIPTDKDLAERGLTGQDLPAPLLQAAAHLLALTAPELNLMEGTTR